MRNPFEVLLVGAYGLYCLAAIFVFDNVASTTLRSFGYGYSLILLLSSAMGAAIALIGMFWKDVALGVFLERAGLYSVCVPTGVYAILSLVNGGSRSLGFFLLLMAMSLASAGRIYQLHRAVYTARTK
jgi:hypothetical protein